MQSDAQDKSGLEVIPAKVHGLNPERFLHCAVCPRRDYDTQENLAALGWMAFTTVRATYHFCPACAVNEAAIAGRNTTMSKGDRVHGLLTVPDGPPIPYRGTIVDVQDWPEKRAIKRYVKLDHPVMVHGHAKDHTVAVEFFEPDAAYLSDELRRE